MSQNFTRHFGLIVTLWNWIWEMFISNLGRDGNYPDWSVVDFLSLCK
jgi:hypothetical protein